MAGLCVAALYGLEYPDALKIARDLYVSVDASTVKELRQLPASCYEAGEILLKDRDIYEKYGIFPAGMIEKLAQDLKAHNDKGMSEKLYGNEGALKEVVKKFFHCG
jgi:glutamine synthetase